MKPEIEEMTIFDYSYLYSAYADNATFFMKDIISTKHMVFNFYFFTSIKIASIGVLKGVQVAVCGIDCIDLNIGTLKIFLLERKIEKGKNFL